MAQLEQGEQGLRAKVSSLEAYVRTLPTVEEMESAQQQLEDKRALAEGLLARVRPRPPLRTAPR